MPDSDVSGAADGREFMRQFLINVALSAYEDAGLAGLCADGRWEAAVGAMRAATLPTLPATRPER